MKPFSCSARGLGKNAVLERQIHEWLKKNPQAVVARIRGGQVIVEKPVMNEPLQLESTVPASDAV